MTQFQDNIPVALLSLSYIFNNKIFLILIPKKSNFFILNFAHKKYLKSKKFMRAKIKFKN